jgi:hypothetical protein
MKVTQTEMSASSGLAYGVASGDSKRLSSVSRVMGVSLECFKEKRVYFASHI